MTTWHLWITQPKRLWVRRASFQIHLFCGLVSGLYLLAVCGTGSGLLFYYALVSSRGLGVGETYEWFVLLHGGELFGATGVLVNQVGGVLLTVICLTGAVIWWPGIKSWSLSLVLNINAGWDRLLWTTHSSVGFWSFAFVISFAVTGVFLTLPPAISVGAFSVDFGAAYGPLRSVMGRLHIGPVDHWSVYGVWGILGLAPIILFFTGALMWWNRVLRPIRTGLSKARDDVSK